jgi:hypothetical protein
MTKKAFIYVSLLSILIIMFGFQRDKGPDPEVVQKGVEIKIDQFRKRKYKECKKRALERALVVADSLMAAQALFIKNDTINRPPRAIKPEKPKFAPVPDSISVQPILKRE